MTGTIRPRDLLEPVAAGAGAVLAMAGVAILGLYLTGAGKIGQLPGMAAATVGLAVGGSAGLGAAPTLGDLGVSGLGSNGAALPFGGLAGGRGPAGGRLPFGGLTGHGGGGLGIGLQGSVHGLPLGVTLAGAVVFGVLLLVPVRRRGPLPTGNLLLRAGLGLASVLGALALLTRAGHGALKAQSVRRLPTLSYHTDLRPVLIGGLIWAVFTLALAALAAGVLPIHPAVRRTGRAVLGTLLGLVAAGTLLGLVAAVGLWDARLAGAALLIAPNLVFLAVPLGLGVSWSLAADPAFLDRLLPGSHSLSLSGLTASGRPLWPVPVTLAVLTLLACAVLSASGSPAASVRRRSLITALCLGVAFGIVLPASAALTGVSADAGVSLFGHTMLGASLSLHADLVLATLIGLAGGALAGFLGGLLRGVVEGYRARRTWTGVVRDRDAEPAGSRR
jgi:hypothetical protein